MALELLEDSIRSRLRSGVAITGIAQCVTELVENAIDAGATCIAVRIDIGKFTIQVVDNGRGVSRDDLVRMGSRYMTSKCHSLEDLDNNLQHMGYRGEALASIIDVSQTVEICSRHRLSHQTYSKIYHNGKSLDVTLNRSHRPSVGTTVSVHGFFYNMPVRRKVISEALELERVRKAVQCIALVHPLISFTIRNDSTTQCVLQTHKASSILNNFAIFFGNDKVVNMEKVALTNEGFKLSGFISKDGHHSKALQFIYVNSRIVKKTRLHECVNTLLANSLIARRVSRQESNSTQGRDVFSPRCTPDKHGMYVLTIECSRTEYDISLEPLKTLIEFKHWEDVIKALESLTREFLVKHNLTLCPAIEGASNSFTSSFPAPAVRLVLNPSEANTYSEVGSHIRLQSQPAPKSQLSTSGNDESDISVQGVDIIDKCHDVESDSSLKTTPSNESSNETHGTLREFSSPATDAPEGEPFTGTTGGSTAISEPHADFESQSSVQRFTPLNDNSLPTEATNFNQSASRDCLGNVNDISLPFIAPQSVCEPSHPHMTLCSSAGYQRSQVQSHFVSKSLSMKTFQSFQRLSHSQKPVSTQTQHPLNTTTSGLPCAAGKKAILSQEKQGAVPKLRSPLQSGSLSSKLSSLFKLGERNQKKKDLYLTNPSFQQHRNDIHPLQTSLHCRPVFQSTPVSESHALDSNNTVQNQQHIGCTSSNYPELSLQSDIPSTTSTAQNSTLPTQALTEYTYSVSSFSTTSSVAGNSGSFAFEALNAVQSPIQTCSSSSHDLQLQAETVMELTPLTTSAVNTIEADCLSSLQRPPIHSSPVDTTHHVVHCVEPSSINAPSLDDQLPAPVEVFPFELVQANLDRISGCASVHSEAACLDLEAKQPLVEFHMGCEPMTYNTDDNGDTDSPSSVSLPRCDGTYVQSVVATIVSSAEYHHQYPPVLSVEPYCSAITDECLTLSESSDDMMPGVTTVDDLEVKKECAKKVSQESDVHRDEHMPLHKQGDSSNSAARKRIVPDSCGRDTHQYQSVGPKKLWRQQVNSKTGRTIYVHSLTGNVRNDKPPDILLDENDNIGSTVSNSSLEVDSALGDSVSGSSNQLHDSLQQEECYLGAKPLRAAPHLTHDFSAFIPRPKQQRMSGPADVSADPSTSVQTMVSEYRESYAPETNSKWRSDKELSTVRESVVLSGKSTPNDYVRSLESILETWQNPAFLPGQEDIINVGYSRHSQGQIRVHNVINRYQFCKEMFTNIKVLGQVDNKFIACLMSTSKTNGQDLLVMIDQHAAHERVRLEVLTENIYEEPPSFKCPAPRIKSSLLQPPVKLSLQQAERELAKVFRKQMEALGVSLVFGGGGSEVQVCSLPAVFMEREASEVRRGRPAVALSILQDMIVKHLELLQSTSGGSSTLPAAITNILNSQACHGAIKFGDALSLPECESLIHSLSQCKLPFQCAHGRPALMPILDLGILRKRYPSQERVSFPRLSRLLPRV